MLKFSPSARSRSNGPKVLKGRTQKKKKESQRKEEKKITFRQVTKMKEKRNRLCPAPWVAQFPQRCWTEPTNKNFKNLETSVPKNVTEGGRVASTCDVVIDVFSSLDASSRCLSSVVTVPQAYMDRRRRSLIRLQLLAGICLPIRIKKVEPCKNLTAWRNSFATDLSRLSWDTKSRRVYRWCYLCRQCSSDQISLSPTLTRHLPSPTVKLRANKWIIIIGKNLPMTHTCSSGDPKAEIINQNSIPTMAPRCTAFIGSIQVHAQEEKFSNYSEADIIPSIYYDFTPPLNQRHQLKPSKINTLNLDDLKTAEFKLNQYKVQLDNLEKGSFTHRHLSTFAIITTVVVVAIIVYVICPKCRLFKGLIGYLKGSHSDDGPSRPSSCCPQIFNYCNIRSNISRRPSIRIQTEDSEEVVYQRNIPLASLSTKKDSDSSPPREEETYGERSVISRLRPKRDPKTITLGGACGMLVRNVAHGGNWDGHNHRFNGAGHGLTGRRSEVNEGPLETIRPSSRPNAFATLDHVKSCQSRLSPVSPEGPGFAHQPSPEQW
ncbi:hypothetical protein GEV33_004160 [Tenebrio molitor]|uniref:Uncharacterized protein n=1 Tax=Tenebrio molitor TaxID=7067 RepID=A0A8J6LMZ3_TENMO|nr:hypothetical protein GEV33_004160 [Tenebrio molitor]